MKYIPAEKLKAEIEMLKSTLADPLCGQRNILGPDWVAGGNKMLKEISSFIDTLQQEQPEVDWEKELDRWRHDHFKGKRDGDYSGEYLVRESQLDLARHFYELGLNTRKP